MGARHGTPDERFWRHVKITRGCWFWVGAKIGSGAARHGQFFLGSVDGKKRFSYAHRFIYRLAVGEIPDGLVVRHKCDNPACVRPDHLELGSHLDNMHDAVQRGRIARGERHHSSKLSNADAEAIRRERLAGTSVKVLAARYGIRESTVSQIANGQRRWLQEAAS
jgi:hypothetical protein